MAKKSRTPPPPRRVQAPRQRKAEAPEGRRRRLLLLAGAALAAAAIAAGAVVAYLAFGGGSSADGTLRAAGCEVVKRPAQGRQHVEELGEDFEYNTFPPSTGPHHPIPAPFDVYSEPIEPFRILHDLEHGGVAVQYGEDVPAATVDELRGWYLDDPNGLVLAPLPELEDKIALTAWTAPPALAEGEARPGEGIVATCPGFDPEAFEAFLDAYGFRGPESCGVRPAPCFAREDLRPGT